MKTKVTFLAQLREAMKNEIDKQGVITRAKTIKLGMNISETELSRALSTIYSSVDMVFREYVEKGIIAHKEPGLYIKV